MLNTCTLFMSYILVIIQNLFEMKQNHNSKLGATEIYSCKQSWSMFFWHSKQQLKSSFAKTDKRHPKTELFTPPCSLYYLVFNVKIFFGKIQQSSVCLPAKTYAISHKPIFLVLGKLIRGQRARSTAPRKWQEKCRKSWHLCKWDMKRNFQLKTLLLRKKTLCPPLVKLLKFTFE